VYMLIAKRVAGNSGALKALILGPREPTKLAFLGGLVTSGALMGRVLPMAFESAPPASLALAASGLAVGLGTALGNGCTSGHGLCGLSRLSVRSLAAVPTFMGFAVATATIRSGSTLGTPLPIGATPPAVLELATKLASGLAVALLPAALISDDSSMQLYAGLWSGATFGVGLALGGMVRPSVVTNALSPAQFDGTLWVLFMTALAVTFGFYRLSGALGVKEASAAAAAAKVDTKLLLGAALFGVGWGSSGLCPGPHVVGIAAAPLEAGPLLMLGTVGAGMHLSSALAKWLS